MNLSPAALRVLGALVEKDRTTPEYYPLSLNALVAACNQKTNREPVMALDEAEVERALQTLRGKGLALVSAQGGRVSKHAHNLIGKLQVEVAELAVLGELMLRGPQTPGELRARAERMHHFGELWEVEAALQRLCESEPPLVAKMPRQPGHKESRYRHLLGAVQQVDGAPAGARFGGAAGVADDDPDADDGDGNGDGDGDGEVDADARSMAPGSSVRAAPGEPSAPPDDERVSRLEEEVRELRAELAALWKELRSLTLQPDE